jgi:hypothetical protein
MDNVQKQNNFNSHFAFQKKKISYETRKFVSVFTRIASSPCHDMNMKSSLGLIKHRTMTTYGEWRYSSTVNHVTR